MIGMESARTSLALAGAGHLSLIVRGAEQSTEPD